jgi:hypothetical protein
MMIASGALETVVATAHWIVLPVNIYPMGFEDKIQPTVTYSNAGRMNLGCWWSWWTVLLNAYKAV